MLEKFENLDAPHEYPGKEFLCCLLLLVFLFPIPALCSEGKELSFSGEFFALVGGAGRVYDSSDERYSQLKFPKLTFETEIRPRIKISPNYSFSMFLRPRIGFYAKTYEENKKGTLEGTEETHDTGEIHDLGELYFDYSPNETVVMSYGQQNFQWGPTDTWSPSNFIFIEHGFERNSFTSTPWKNLLRINYTPDANLSVVGLYELTPFSKASPSPETDNTQESQKALVKVDYSYQGTPNNLGVIIGCQKDAKPWLGGYGQLEALDGLLVYIDVSITKEAEFVTAAQKTLDRLLFPQRESRKNSSYRGVGGIKYTFSDSSEVKAEALWHNSGFSGDDMETIFSAMDLQPALAPLMASLAGSSGEPMGRSYFLLNTRIPDLGVQNRLVMQGKLVVEPYQGSGFVAVNSEYVLTDSLLVYLLAKKTFGPDNSEFGWLTSWSSVMGVKTIW